MGRSDVVFRAFACVFMIIWSIIGIAIITTVVYYAANDDPILPTPPAYSEFDPDGAGYPDPYST